jgi:hypothetical protein
MSDDRDALWQLLSEGLDLCVRARTMDSIDRRAATLAISVNPEAWKKDGTFDRYVARNNIVNPDTPIHTKSATMPLWLIEQYDRDLADWERRSRKHLVEHPCYEDASVPESGTQQ